MKLLQYGPAGMEKPGVIDQDGILRDISSFTARITGKTLTPALLDELRYADLRRQPQVLGNPRLGACISQLKKFICIGPGDDSKKKDQPSAPPIQPVVFIPHSHSGEILDFSMPCTNQSIEFWERDLAVVIGRSGRYIAEQFVGEHIAGYCTLNNSVDALYPTEQEVPWEQASVPRGFGSVGPCLLTTEELGDPQHLEVKIEFSNQRHQTGDTLKLSVAKVISYLSYQMTLRPGDLISVGRIPKAELPEHNEDTYIPLIDLSIDNSHLEMLSCLEYI